MIDIGFLEKIGVWENWSDDAKLYLLTVKTNIENIDFGRTIGNRLLYPREFEFTLINNSKIKIINKKILKRKDIQY